MWNKKRMKILANCQNEQEKDELEKSLQWVWTKDFLAGQMTYFARFRAEIYKLQDVDGTVEGTIII